MKLIYSFEAVQWSASPLKIERVLREELNRISGIYDSLSARNISQIDDVLICRDCDSNEELSFLNGGSFMDDKSCFIHPVEFAFFDIIQATRRKTRTINLDYKIYTDIKAPLRGFEPRF